MKSYPIATRGSMKIGIAGLTTKKLNTHPFSS